MEIKLFLSNDIYNDIVTKMVQEIIPEIAKSILTKIEDLQVIGVAGTSQYANALEQLIPGGRFTDKGGYLGVGKTDTKIDQSGPKHTILFNEDVFERCSGGMSRNTENVEDWSAEELLGLYIIAHELGHCRFNDEHRELMASIEFDATGLDDFEIIDKHHFGIVVGDVGACFFGHRYYNNALLEYVWNLDKAVLEDTYQALQLAKTKGDAKDVAYRAAGFSWLYIIQFSKNIISMFNTPFDGVLLKPPQGLTELSEINARISSAVTEFCSFNFVEVEEFRQKMKYLQQHFVAHCLNVIISKEAAGGYYCSWK